MGGSVKENQMSLGGSVKENKMSLVIVHINFRHFKYLLLINND